MNDEKISARLLDQRLRNRIMESLDWLAEGNDGVGSFGAGEWFEQFFDQHNEQRGRVFENEAMTAEERDAFLAVYRLMGEAAKSTPKKVTDEALISSGWPARIAPAAQAAVDLMMKRGRFSEEIEESEPSDPLR